MRLFILLLIVPAITFAQNKKTIFLESGSALFTSFSKSKQEVYNTIDYTSNLKYTYKTTAGFYIKAGLEIGQNTSKRFNVTVPVSIGYKDYNTTVVKSGSSYNWMSSFYGTQITKTTNSYGSIMVGPKFNFNLKKFTLYSALNMNVDLFLNSKSKIITNDESAKVLTNDFKIESLKSDDVTLNTSLQIGADYRITEHFQIGISAEAYFLRLNNMMSKSGHFFLNYNYGNRSSIINCGIKLGYNF